MYIYYCGNNKLRLNLDTGMREGLCRYAILKMTIIKNTSTVTKFQSSVYFEHIEPNMLASLPATPKTNQIKVFSKFINDLIGYPNLEIKESDSEFSVNLSKVNCSKSVDINSNNVKRITVADDWSSSLNRELHNITIDFNGYIEIELVKRVNYDLVVDYLYELQIFMQLYYPYNFRVDKIYVMVDGAYYKLSLPQREFEYKEKHREALKITFYCFTVL